MSLHQQPGENENDGVGVTTTREESDISDDHGTDVQNPHMTIQYPVPLPNCMEDFELAVGACEDVWFNPKKRKIDRVIPSATIMKESHLHELDNTYLLGILLTVEKGKNPITVFPSGSSIGTQKIYDRLVTFADVLHPGRCFTMVLSTKPKSDFFFQYKSFQHGAPQSYGVGTPFLIKEVYHSTDKLGRSPHSMTLMEGCSGYAIPLENAVRHVPYSGLDVPKHPLTINYFCYHKVTTLKLSAVEMVQAGRCGGSLCDRQIEPNAQSWECGCFHANNKQPAWVMRMNVAIPCETNMNSSGTTFIFDFKSRKTTSVFVDDTTVCFWRPSFKSTDQLREKAKAMVDYVNYHGGWTILGWIQSGQESEDSDLEDKKIIAGVKTNTAPHLTYMMPSHLPVLNNLTFKFIQYRVPETTSNDGQSEDDEDEDDSH